MFKPATKEELKEILNTQKIKLYEIDTSLITDMSYLFDGVFWWDFEGINTWDTNNVTDMSAMFYDCYSLNKKILFDTKNVKTMRNMFVDCRSFNQKLSFNTKNVEDFSGMFSGCKSLNQTFDFDMSSAKKID
ncbi:BspA family leucine-rich repeat surface protein [Campylobacter sp. MG1]|uniref:BspA family leucine-rich repeat surface protein n=1 Tax=Campylobacter sp. MG1 TaxID=2976332 RepID=UPI00226C969B|nr:BspA family leucine-rich repeat surface protein [Campylobacter sp. MG1]